MLMIHFYIFGVQNFGESDSWTHFRQTLDKISEGSVGPEMHGCVKQDH